MPAAQPDPGPIPASELAVIRDLAKRVRDVAHRPEEAQKAALWRAHNDLEPGRPLVLTSPEGAWGELLPASAMACAHPVARGIEWNLRSRLYWAEHLADDNVRSDVYEVGTAVSVGGTGIPQARRTPSGRDRGADHFEPVLHSMADLEGWHLPEVSVDWEASARWVRDTEEIFGGILKVDRTGGGWSGMSPLDQYSQLRGLDQMFLDLVDCPELVHAAVGRLTDLHIHVAREMERLGVLTETLRNHYSGSGGTCYTSQLPGPGHDGKHWRNLDRWGFATSQIFSEVSPAMHEEFALRHEKRFQELFGLNAYGCCEPLDRKLDLIKRHIPRLRRVSISPWADIGRSAEGLGKDYIFSWKPNPSILAGERFNPDAVRREIRGTLARTRGCVVEIVMKDTHTVRDEPRRYSEWVRIALEEAQDAK